MNRKINVLGGLLVAQVLLTVVLWAVNRPQSKIAEPLLNIDPAAVDQIEIADADKTVELVRKEGRWQLPALADLPAAAGKVKQLIEKLANFKPDWPETTTAASHQRFELAEDHFQRRIKLAGAGQTQADLLVGTSPGFRKSHVRKAGDDAVYAVEISAFDLPTQAVDWLDKNLLTAEQISEIRGAEYALVKNDGIWQWDLNHWPKNQFQPISEKPDQDKVAALVSVLAGLTILDLADHAELDPSVEKNLVVVAKSKAFQYNFWKQGEEHFIYRDDREHIFRFSAFDYQRIVEVDQSSLTPSKTPQTDAGVSPASPAE